MTTRRGRELESAEESNVQQRRDDDRVLTASKEDHDLCLIDGVALLAAELPQGYRLLLAKAPSAQPYQGRLACNGTRHSSADARIGTRQRKRRRSWSLDVSEAVRWAIAHLPNRTGRVESEFPFIIRESLAGEPIGEIGWAAAVDSRKKQQDSLDAMRLAWARRTGDDMFGNDGSAREEIDTIMLDGDEHQVNIESLVGKLVINPSDAFRTARIPDEKSGRNSTILAPHRSAMLATDLLASQTSLPLGWQSLLHFARDHPPTLILLDPPYPNFSAKRLCRQKDRYSTVNDLYDLWRIKEPLKSLLRVASDRLQSNRSRPEDDEPLVACWVTNDPKAQKFVVTKLFPACDLQLAGQIVWLKTTVDFASPVLPLDDTQGRKPYEVLLLGKLSRMGTSLDFPGACTKTHIFACAPFGHSRKPPIMSLLRPWLAHCGNGAKIGTNVYELFARQLAPGTGHSGYWVSIGNEPCHFNQVGVGVMKDNRHIST